MPSRMRSVSCVQARLALPLLREMDVNRMEAGPERSRVPLALLGALLVVAIVASTGTARAAWDEISRVLGLQG